MTQKPAVPERPEWAPQSCLDFEDELIQKHCDKVISAMTTLSEELQAICALLDALCWFKLTEGEQSPRVRAIIKRLCAFDLRPSLKEWYSQHGQSNGAADAFRKMLEREIGETLG